MKTKLSILVLMAMAAIFLTSHPAIARQFTVGGRPLNVFGYVTQGVAYSMNSHANEDYDTEAGFQSALSNLFLEADYSFTDDLQWYGSGMLTTNWIYNLKENDRSWKEKLFADSRELRVDDKSWQLLKEMHVTWTPGNFLFRVGKQIVAWGETDGLRLMDQINPLDQRRGFADVEFETSIIPIWLLRAEYFPEINSSWLEDLGFQFIFNPNADFIPNQLPATGNDVGGIWAPNIMLAPGLRLGSAKMNIREPHSWNHEGFEYGFRIRGVADGAIFTLNYFYGIDDTPVLKMAPVPPTMTVASDGTLLLHPTFQGYYPRLRFVGATFSRDITPLKASFLGGVAPVVRLEGFYAFDNTFATSLNKFEKSDEIRLALGVDWKVKIPFLNPRAYFSISPQFFDRKILNYPSGYDFLNVEEDNYTTTLMINTTYLHNKLVPLFFWLHDMTNRSDLYKLQLTYDYSNEWHYTIGGIFINGKEPGKGLQPFENKNQLYFKISYKWG